jgi:hypothetical protein
MISLVSFSKFALGTFAHSPLDVRFTEILTTEATENVVVAFAVIAIAGYKAQRGAPSQGAIRSAKLAFPEKFSRVEYPNPQFWLKPRDVAKGVRLVPNRIQVVMNGFRAENLDGLSTISIAYSY